MGTDPAIAPTPAPPHAPVERLHALDGLRGFAMFLGVVLHAGIPYMHKPPAFWPVRDANGNPAVDLFMLAVHDFRMQTFFVLAGFFGGLLHRRYGLRTLLAHRAKRIAVPLAVGVVTVVPPTLAVGLYAEVLAFRAGDSPATGPFRQAAADLAADPSRPAWRVVGDFFTSGQVLTALIPLHLWFLYYLVWFYAIAAVAVPLLAKGNGTRIVATGDRLFRWVVGRPWGILIPAVLIVPPLCAMPALVVDTPAGWAPNVPLMGYYLGFFAFGWLLDRHRDLAPAFGRRWGRMIGLANVAVLPVLTVLVVGGTDAERTAGEKLAGWRVAAAGASGLYTWLMIAGLWGLFLAKLPGERAWVRYLADASYWCYLASLPPTLAFQVLAAPLPVPWFAKLLFVVAGTLAVLLASYEWGVRYTAIGALLNGRKHRRAVAAGA